MCPFKICELSRRGDCSLCGIWRCLGKDEISGGVEEGRMRDDRGGFNDGEDDEGGPTFKRLTEGENKQQFMKLCSKQRGIQKKPEENQREVTMARDRRVLRIL